MDPGPSEATEPIMPRHPTPRTVPLAFVLMAALSLPASGCYTYHVYQIGGPDGRELGNQPSTEWQGRTLHAFAWGAVRQDLPVDNCRLGSGQPLGIEEVRVDTNLAYLIASTATLGLWVPLRVNWRCARPPVPGGPLGADGG
jgi:hypothetical protein